ncbi:hypothetical protein D3C80_1438950 [compost metagenome]
MSGLQQGLLVVEPLLYLFDRRLAKIRQGLMVQAIGAAARPGCLDQGGVGKRGAGYGHGTCPCMNRVVIGVRPWKWAQCSTSVGQDCSLSMFSVQCGCSFVFIVEIAGRVSWAKNTH